MTQRIKTFTQTWPDGRVSRNDHVSETMAQRLLTWDPFQHVPAWREYSANEVNAQLARYNYEYGFNGPTTPVAHMWPMVDMWDCPF